MPLQNTKLIETTHIYSTPSIPKIWAVAQDDMAGREMHFDAHECRACGTSLLDPTTRRDALCDACDESHHD